MTSSALVHSDNDNDNDFGYEMAPAPTASASTASAASAQTELLPVSVADQIASVIGGLATEAAKEANTTFAAQASVILPQLARQHQENLGHLAAAIVTIYGGGPRGNTFAAAFEAGVDAAGLASRTYAAPSAPDFAAIAQDAIDEA